MSTSEQVQAFVADVRRQLKHELSVFVSAWLYFTRIPLPRTVITYATPEHSLATSIRYAPLIGIIIGVCAALIFVGSLALFQSKSLAILLGLLASILITGGMHEDGTAHFFDAFTGAKRSKKDILDRLKQPGVSTAGSLVVLFSVLLSHQSLVSLDTYLAAIAFVVAHAFARFVALSFVLTNEPADKQSTSGWGGAPHTFLIMAAFGMLPLLLTGNLLFLLLVPLLWIVRALFGMWFVSKIGGWTADTLSAVLLVTVVATFMLIYIASRYTFSV